MKNEFGLGHPQTHLDMIAKMRDFSAPGSILVEVGAYAGVSTYVFAEGGRTVYAVDPWHWDAPTYDHRDELMATVRKLGGGRALFQTFCRNAGEKLFKSIIPIRAYSDEMAQVFPFQVDMVYIDGCHAKECVETDIKSWWPVIRNGGIMCGDDYGGFDVKEVVDKFFPHAQKPYHAQWLVYKNCDTL